MTALGGKRTIALTVKCNVIGRLRGGGHSCIQLAALLTRAPTCARGFAAGSTSLLHPAKAVHLRFIAGTAQFVVRSYDLSGCDANGDSVRQEVQLSPRSALAGLRHYLSCTGKEPLPLLRQVTLVCWPYDGRMRLLQHCSAACRHRNAGIRRYEARTRYEASGVTFRSTPSGPV